jgi:hypothetical protein
MAGNPALSQLRAGWENNGIGFEALTLPHSIPFVSETLSAELERIESATITSGGEKAESELGKIPVNGQTVHELDAENPVLFLAASMGLGEDPVTVDGPNSVVSHKLARSESDIVFPGAYSVEVNIDDGNPVAYLGGNLASMAIALAPRTFNTLTLEHHFESVNWYDAPSEEVPGATANDVAPQLRSIPSYADLQLADGDIWVQVNDASGVPGSVELLVKVGDAASYGAIPTIVQTGLKGTGQPYWTPLIDSTSGRAIGTLGHEVEIAIVDDTGYEDLDEWSFARDRDVWVNSFADTPKLTEVHARIYIGADEFDLTQLTATHNLLANPYMPIGRRFARRIDQLGQRSYQLELQRRYTDTELWHRIITAESVAITVDMLGKSYIGSGSEQHRVSLIYPRVVFGGRGPGVENQEEITESATGMAHPDPGNVDGYTAAATIEIQGTVADLTA